MTISKNIAYLCLIALLISGCTCSRRNRDRRVSPRKESNRRIQESTVVKMVKEDGVYYVPIKVNGLELKFIFDTGASSISLSSAEAAVMYKQGKITEDDIVGTERFSDATGRVSEGTKILLRTVEIGGIELHNIEASVVGNIEAPLLLGQTALSKFGKVTIDYNRGTIAFN